MQDEMTLVKRAVRGDTGSLAELLRRNYTFLYQYALKITLDKSRAEDVTQETMLKAIEKITSFQSKSKFSTWLITIASRLVVDRARRAERERKWLQEEQALQSQQQRTLRYDTMLRMNEWPEALQAASQLTEQVRMPILLKYYYGYSQEEIAGMLGVPVGTVKSRLHNGLKQLKKELAENEQ